VIARLYRHAETIDRAIVDAVGMVAGRRNISRTQVALAWLLQKPGITAPVLGASRTAHLEEAVAALSLRLDEADIAQLESVYLPHPVSY
jgi:1-deoxyxylulose-5-phosphate synthase